jgi:glycerophosphoryl diester phosphodiesterase
MRPLVISHAACGGHAPANTLAGINAALGMGVDGIEIDVQCSSDGVPVLMHDYTVDRTTNGTGEVSKLTLDQLRALDAGGEPPPTLAEVLEHTRGNALLVCEIKQPGIEQRVVDVVLQAEALDDVMVWSFFPQALTGMRAAEPRIPAALLVSERHTDALPTLRDTAISIGAQGLSVYYEGVGDDAMRLCRRSGLALYAWTADDPAAIQRLVDTGIDGICTNFPDRVSAALASTR